MHYYTFHPAKFNLETRQLTRLERAIYRELLDEYTGQEQPLTADFDKLAWRMCVRDEDEKQALKLVLDNFFVLKTNQRTGETFYHHPRLDREIRAYKWNKKDESGENGYGTDENGRGTDGNANEKEKERKKRYKENKQKIIAALSEKGVKLTKSMSMDNLRKLFNIHCGSENDTQGTDNGTHMEQNRTDKEQKERPKSDVKQETINNKPVTNNKKQENKHAAAVSEIFGFWVDIFDKNPDKTKLTDKRERKIIERLDDGYSAQDIKQAIYNCSRSEYHTTHGYTDLELICREPEKTDMFLTMKPQTWQKNQAPKPDPLVVNAKWANYEPPANWEENLDKAIANLQQSATGNATSPAGLTYL